MGSRHLDLLYRSVSVASITDVGRNFLEALGFCGQNKFPTSQEIDVTGTSADATCVLQSSNQKTFYDRYIVSDGILRFGTGFTEKSLNDESNERPSVENDEHFVNR
jgi:hypothetical protein